MVTFASTDTALVPPPAASSGLEILALQSGQEQFGSDISELQKLGGCRAVPKIANSPDFIKGLIHLRGGAITIMALCIRLYLNLASYSHSTVVVILSCANRWTGTVPDSVLKAVRCTIRKFVPSPTFATLKEWIAIQLDIDRLLTIDVIKN